MFRIDRPPSPEETIDYTLITEETSESSLCGDLVYFDSKDTQSYAVYLKRPNGMNEEDIADFIQSKDPNLYERLLRKRTVLSISAVVAHGAFHQSQIASHASVVLEDSDPSSYTEIGSCSNLLFSSPSQVLDSSQLERSETFYKQDLLLLQWKRHIVGSLLNGNLLFLHKTTPWRDDFTCNFPLCANDALNKSEASYFLTTCPAKADVQFKWHPGSAHFCLKCVEDLFPVNRSPERRIAQACSSGFDGVRDEGIVAAAAQRLAVRHIEGSLDALGLPFHYPSNSPQALHLRRNRDIEIGDILKKVEKGERRAAASLNTTSPSLVITPPADIGSFQDRYKKQGLGPYDKKKEQAQLAASLEQQKGNPPERARITVTSKTSPLLMCYCREPEDDSESIHCSSEYCVVGWVHLCCSGLDCLPRTGDLWYCRYCAETFHSSISATKETDDRIVLCNIHREEQYDFADDDGPGNGADIENESEDITYEADSDNDGGIVEVDYLSPPKTLQWLQNAGDGSSFHPVTGHNANAAFQPAHPASHSSLTTSLPPGHANTTFLDLAPFIIADQSSLTVHHIAALAQWKALCPPSRLLKPIPSPVGSGRRSMYFSSPVRSELLPTGTEAKQVEPAMKLSAVLADVDRQGSIAGDADMQVADPVVTGVGPDMSK